ncbi:MAG: DNA/RNA non-specific endonuclease [Ginsengibacter sp.]
MLISVDQLEESARRYAALDQQPVRDHVSDLSEEAVIQNVPRAITEGNIIGKEENITKRIEMLSALRKEPVDFAFERAIGENDSVYSNFVELIRNAKQKVGRVAVKIGNKNIAFATGFMVAENLMLTNWHVFKTREDVADSEIQFHYELDILGNPRTAVSFKLQSNVFYYSNKQLDYCFVAVSDTDLSGTISIHDTGYIFLDPALGKLGNEKEEALNIIHHPDGDYMQLSIRKNLFTNITPTSIWYQTDTAPGSSGSPVFNDQWQVVALHHMGVGRRNIAGEYIDKEGLVIPKINGKIDPSKIVWEANEGIRISVVLKDIFATFPGHPMVQSLQAKPGITALENGTSALTDLPSTHLKNDNMETDSDYNNVRISFPASLIERTGVINISISQENLNGVSIAGTQQALTDTAEADAEELKQLEAALDFSLCKGYQSRFLGTHLNISLPKPQKALKKFIAKINGTDSYILKYFKYSTIFHSVRMMPVISAINVDGNPDKRLDTTARKDTWLRDTRLGFDIQLDDAFYRNSGFDRGHMSRREDANWGTTAEEAKKNADLTCMYTNTCPQLAGLNQSGRKGLWGKLEKVVLESGAEAETGRTGKISVFNGPVFKEADPVFRGIQIPMDFYKIILWLTDNGNLKATAFKLTQVGLTDDIDFEQLDLEQNSEFKEFQCSIKSLQEATQIDFSDLFQYDTFEGNEGEEVELHSELELMAHINKQKED